MLGKLGLPFLILGKANLKQFLAVYCGFDIHLSGTSEACPKTMGGYASFIKWQFFELLPWALGRLGGEPDLNVVKTRRL
jgi:hypothetical protein